jgi:PDZ domain-containing protein
MDTQKSRAGRFRFSVPPRLERTLNIVSLVALVLVVLALILWHLPSSYQVLLPATAESVESQIYVAHHPARSGRGHFFMTFVEEPDPNLLLSLVARLDPDASVDPLPPNYSVTQNIQQGQVDMLSSEQTAELVALCHLGYPKLCSGGVQVVQVEPYSKAGTLLKSGDVITAVNGTAVASPAGLVAVLATQAPGSHFRVTLRRGKTTLTETIPSVRSPSKPYTTALGIEVQTAPPLSLPSTLPIDMKINPGNIGGPSAGLMFTLGLLNRLSPTDLTHGYPIAGTGTISLDGSVGPIGGVKQKVIGAEWAHAKYFFVPCSYGNYTDARKEVGKSMMLVPVNTLDDALTFLKALATNPHPPVASCAGAPQ